MMATRFVAAAAGVAKPRFKAATKFLGQHGVEAMKPTFVSVDPTTIPDWQRTHETWKRPIISGRKAAYLRKQAKKDGVYGSFDAETGIGWDPEWDIELAKNRARGQGRYALRIPKKSKRMRTRDERVAKIEKSLEGMDQRIEELHYVRQTKKPVIDFDYIFKKHMRGKGRVL